jgi:hypothetical protein
MKHLTFTYQAWIGVLLIATGLGAMAQTPRPLNPRAAAVIQHWTPERIRQATPRDLLIDERGLGYLRQRDGYLQPYGHDVPAVQPTRDAVPSPFGKPTGGSGDSEPPKIAEPDPGPNATIPLTYLFKATVTDNIGVSSVTFKIGTTSITANPPVNGSNVWSRSISFAGPGSGTYQIVAKDTAGRGGNTTTSDPIAITVTNSGDTTGSTGCTTGTKGGTTLVSEAAWACPEDAPDAVTQASGRIYFEMPANKSRRSWAGYVCSGTVAADNTLERSIIITAAHCVYDDANKAFARNVLFIPNQNATTGSGTDGNCSNDPMGCWAASFGVVDTEWTNKTFPANIPWDYAFYVVSDSGSHTDGLTQANDALDIAAGSLIVQFDPGQTSGAFTHALGYSYSKDPSLRYCAQNLGTESSYGDWWLAACGLSGGASGGPWIQPMDVSSGSGPIISVNSWGYTNQPGMGGPPLSGNSASCRFKDAQDSSLEKQDQRDGDQGYIGTGTNCP